MNEVRKIKRNKVISIIVFLIIIIGFIILLINYFTPFYKLEDRTKNKDSFVGVNGEKAIGWLRVQGTNIDFPIVYYDDTDVTDPTNDLGWSYSPEAYLTKREIIFSHNVLNVSKNPLITNENHRRFEQLLSFIYPEFTKKNKYIEYTVGNKNYLYKIYSISFRKEKDIRYEDNEPTKNEMKKYIDYSINSSYFKFDVDVKPTDKLITLVTCTRFFGATTDYSFVIDARMVRDKEKIKNYSLTEKKSYNKIKKIMEGDEDNEEEL